MLMILLLHFISLTGILEKYSGLSLGSFIVWFLESLSFCAVNIYVIISGYFLVDSKFKFRKILKIWVEVIFYSLVLFVVSSMITANFNGINFLKSTFPVILGNYWFVTVYIVLYLLSPFINKFIYSLKKQQYKILLIIINIINYNIYNILSFTNCNSN